MKPLMLTVFTARRLNDISNDWSAPQSELIDASIVWLTLCRLEADEIREGCGDHVAYNCGNCGSGLEHLKAVCAVCQKKTNLVEEPNTPLSPKICQHLIEHGHVFQIDPAIARRIERTLWEATKK
ncbi:MAG: hypothetical protein KBC95_01070 [Candidatus Peribacteraceae bacterium]|nr:hypothetical protein [Candidatus Peribacteraceae bacterium]